MASTLNDKFAEGQAASMEQQLSNLAREAGIGPSVPSTSMKTSRPRRQRVIDWRIGAMRLSSVLCRQHPLASLPGCGHPPLIRR